MSERLTDLYQEFVKPQLGQLLKILRLDKNFQKAQGDILTYLSDGKEISVYDFLGGYGSAILGHNPAFLVKEAESFFKHNRALQSQASLRSETARLAKILSATIQNELGTSSHYVSTFASTGTEATEIAIKNSLLLWQQKKEALKRNILALFHSVPRSAEDKSQLQVLVQEIDQVSPVLISLYRSYHGKTASALLSSSNDYYKKMFSNFLFESVFLKLDSNLDSSIEKLFLKVKPYSFKGQEFLFSPFIGFIFEPIQGEGGIRPVGANELKKIFRFTEQLNIPTISDEIQSGVYRTGSFLASTFLKVKPDVILLGKSLGGSLSKISVMCCRDEIYMRELGTVHSSTFAEDDFSSLMAIKTLNHLAENREVVLARSVQFENQIRSFFQDLIKKYPRWIKEVRGRGFFIGVEFNFLNNDNVPTLLYSLAINGHASYLLMSYLLNRHKVRVGVTLSSPETLRIEPSAMVTDEAVEKLKLAFEDLLETMEQNNLAKLFSHIFSKDEIMPDRKPLIKKYVSKPEGVRDIAFLGHIINWDHAQRLDPVLKSVKQERIKTFFSAYAEFSQPFIYHQQIVQSDTGERVRLNLYGLTVVSDFFEIDIKKPFPILVEPVQEFINEVRAEKMSFAGLGQFTSIVTRNGTVLDLEGLPITTGNSLTAGLSIEALEDFVAKKNLKFKDLSVGIVGFAGNIGGVLTQAMAAVGAQLTLVYREPYANSPRFQSAVDDILRITAVEKSQLTLTSDFDDLKNCDIVILATNSIHELLNREHLKIGCAIVDVSVPSNVSRDIRSSKDFYYISAGLARLPKNQAIDHPWLPLLNGDCFACLAETLVLGLSGYKESFSLGALTMENVNLIRKLAREHGFAFTRNF